MNTHRLRYFYIGVVTILPVSVADNDGCLTVWPSATAHYVSTAIRSSNRPTACTVVHLKGKTKQVHCPIFSVINVLSTRAASSAIPSNRQPPGGGSAGIDTVT